MLLIHLSKMKEHACQCIAAFPLSWYLVIGWYLEQAVKIFITALIIQRGVTWDKWSGHLGVPPKQVCRLGSLQNTSIDAFGSQTYPSVSFRILLNTCTLALVHSHCCLRIATAYDHSQWHALHAQCTYVFHHGLHVYSEDVQTAVSKRSQAG